MSELVLRRSGPLAGRVRVPGDKSISHRSLLLGSIAEGPSHVQNLLPAADCQATLRCVRQLGVEAEEVGPTELIVHGRGLRGLREPQDVLDCSRSGTTMRLLAGLLAGQAFFSVLTGDPQLRRRPMGRVAEPLRLMGARVLGRTGGQYPPLAIDGGNLRGIDYSLPVASAQVKSALLLAGLFAREPTSLEAPGPTRDHTERMLAAMGASLQEEGGKTLVAPAERLRTLELVVPGDMSSAAFLVVAAILVPGSQICVEDVGINPTRTGLVAILQTMGAGLRLENVRAVSGEPVADLTVDCSELRSTTVGGELIVRSIDELPILAVAATQAQGTTIVRDAAELRVKETDRIATTVEELQRLGAEIEAQPDGFAVHGPTPLRGARVHSHGDHRLAMALAVAGLIAEGQSVILDSDCIGDSFPGFERALGQLGAFQV